MTEEIKQEHHFVGWEGRFTALERGQIALQKDLSSLTTSVAKSVQIADHLEASLNVLAENQIVNTRTNWGVVLTGFTVFVMVLGLVVYEPLGMVRAGLVNHIHDGHPDTVLDRIEITYNNLTEKIDRLLLKHDELESKVDASIIKQKGAEERLLGIERELYPNAKYRGGRPTGAKKDQ